MADDRGRPDGVLWKGDNYKVRKSQYVNCKCIFIELLMIKKKEKIHLSNSSLPTSTTSKTCVYNHKY